MGERRHYRAAEELERWMDARDVTERDVIAWVHGPSLFRYVQRKLAALLGRKADVEVHPLPTQTARQSLGLAQPPLLAHLRGTHESALDSSTKTAGEPMGTISAGGYGASQINRDVDEPMGTVTAKARHALVEGNEEIDINDCFFRMLMPAEIQLGMAFVADYKVTGNQREKVKQLGQAVTPPVPSFIWARIVESLR